MKTQNMGHLGKHMQIDNLSAKIKGCRNISWSQKVNWFSCRKIQIQVQIPTTPDSVVD